LGVVAAKGSPEQVAAAQVYGHNVGLAFQLIDDLLDADQAKEGNEFNALAVCQNDAAQVKQLAVEYTALAIKALDAFSGDITALKAFAESLLTRVL
jgi:geranylgeranyl pyrophosphate synthase